MGSPSLLFLLPLVAGLDFSYHHTEELETFLKDVHRNYSSITHLYSIGKSVKGRAGLRALPRTAAVVGKES
uniref:Uncharacterized protein n=1 Tax=Varanus komodoensis TaxID=61221 RepID=A0A8D2IKY4_VARKO